MWYNIDRRGHEYTCSATVVHAELLTLKSAIGSVPASTFEATNVELHELDTADKVMEHYLGLATQYLYAKQGSIVTLKVRRIPHPPTDPHRHADIQSPTRCPRARQDFVARTRNVFNPMLLPAVKGDNRAFEADVRTRMNTMGYKFAIKSGSSYSKGTHERSLHLSNTAMQPMANI